MSTRYTYDQPEYLDVEGAKFLVAEIKEYINLVITGGVDLSTYATKEYVDNAVSNVSVDLSDYATKQYVDNAIANSGGNTDPSEPSDPTPTTVSLAITGNAELKVGFSRTYKAVYTDSTSTNVTSNYTTTWTVTPTSNGITASDIQLDTSTANQVKIMVENEDLVDKTFTLTATSSDASISPASIEITVISTF